MEFLNGQLPTHELTYDDVFMVPRASDVGSRFDVDLSSPDGSGMTIPLVVANMTAVAGRRMAETVARRGGLVVLPQDIPVEVVAEVISWVKRRDLVYETALVVRPGDTVSDVLALMPKRSYGAVIVVEENRPIGVVTERDCVGVDRFAPVEDVMSQRLVTVAAAIGGRAAFAELERGHFRLAPVVDEAGLLVGVITRTSALRATLYTPNIDASDGCG